MTSLLGRGPAVAPDEAATVAEVQRLARHLLPECRKLADTVTAWVLDMVPEVAPGRQPEAVEVVRESTEQNIGAVLAMLAFGAVPGEIEPPPGTLKVVRQTAAAGGDLTTVLRAYHLGHAFVSRVWLDHVGTAIDDPARTHAVLTYSSERMFAFFDSACEHLRARFAHEVPLNGTGVPPDQRAVIDRLLAGEPVNAAVIEMTLGYDLRHHHIGLVAAPASDEADVAAELAAISTRLGAGSLLLQPVGDGTWWGWMGFAAPPGEALQTATAQVSTDAVFVGMGESGPGADGFRRTHDEASDACRMGRLSPASPARVVRHRDIELVALLCADPIRAERLVADRLGALSVHSPTGERLRSTLRAYLASGRSKARAAEALHVHQKTVAYRVAQAEALLARPIATDAADLEAALLIDLALHGP